MLAWDDDFSEILHFMIYSNLGMWFRVRTLYLILLGGLTVRGGQT